MKQVSRIFSFLMAFALLSSSLAAPKAQASTSPTFTDLPGGHYNTKISTLAEYGIVSGLEPGKFVPSGPVTRAQMAALIIRSMGRTAEAELAKSVASDYADVPDSHWARGAITLASRAGIIKGDAGRFYPNDNVNYAQAATMLVRALGYEDQVVGGYPAGYVLKANELGLLKDVNFELYGGVNRAEAAVLLYNAIFRAPTSKTQLTWSQTLFKRPSTLSITPLPTYAAPGQELALTASAADVEGKVLSGLPVEFKVTSGAGSIQGNTLTVGEGSPVTVQATLAGLSATTTVTPVTGLAISPETFQANKGGTVQLTATAISNGTRVSIQPEWRVTHGPATVDAQGLLSVTDYGAVTVKASLGSLTAAATGQAVGKVTITSKPDFLVPGLTYSFGADATDSAGNPIAVPVTWAAIGATIDRVSGRLTNPAGNQVTVRATAAGITAEVLIPVIKTIQIYPATATLLVGRTVNFTAKGTDSTGKQYDLQPRWERSNPSIGVIDSSGEFAGVNSGTTDVTASVGSLRGQVSVRVSGQPTRLGITAATTALPVGTSSSTEITVRLLDQAGNLSPVGDQPITLTISDSGRGSLNRTLVLTQQGEAKVTYTTGSAAGVATITASAPGTAMANQAVVISTYQPTPSYVQLSATPQPLATGGGVATITATLRDSNNLAAPAAQNLYVTLTAAGAPAGGLTGTTVTIPAGQSNGSISFISGGAPGAVQINGSSLYPVRGITLQTAVAGNAVKTKIRPVTSETPVTGLSSLQVQVEVLDATGVMRANDNTSQVHLTVAMAGSQAVSSAQEYTATASGGIATFQVPVYVVGTANLTSSLPDQGTGSTDTATAQFVPGVFSSLKLTAQPATLPADGYSQTQVIAEVVDRSGTVLTSINPVVTFRKLVDGGGTNALTDLKVQAVGGRAVLTIQAGRLTGTDTWYATAPGLDTQNLAVVTTTATSGDAYTLRISGSTSFVVGGTHTILVQVVDQQGRVVTTDSNRAITATHNIPGVTIAPNIATTQNGVATFVITGTQAGSGTLTFSTSSMPVPMVQTTASFGSTSSAAYSLFASSSSTSARVGTSVTVWVRVMDTQGGILSTDSGRTITYSSGGSASVSPTSTITSSGLATFTVTSGTVGTVTLTFTSPGLPQPTTSLQITFTN